jgi:hypothetical protein
MNKLNGWQRIFVVYSVIHLLVVALGAAVTWPSASKFSYKNYMQYKIDEIDKALIIGSTYDKPLGSEVNSIRMATGEYLIIHPKFKADSMELLAYSLHDAYSKEISQKQLGHLIRYLFGAFAPLGMLYVSGWAIAWIVRGFKSNKGA